MYFRALLDTADGRLKKGSIYKGRRVLHWIEKTERIAIVDEQNEVMTFDPLVLQEISETEEAFDKIGNRLLEYENLKITLTKQEAMAIIESLTFKTDLNKSRKILVDKVTAYEKAESELETKPL